MLHILKVARGARATKLHLDLAAVLVAARSKPLQVPPPKQQFFFEKLLSWWGHLQGLRPRRDKHGGEVEV